MKLINIFGGPGSGKSVYASQLYSHLACLGYDSELALEFAKELTLEGRTQALGLQFYVTSKQAKRISILRDSADFVVTDSPILTGLVYGGFGFNDEFKSFVHTLHRQFDNINIFVEPDSDIKYQEFGRSQNELEAYNKRQEIKTLLDSNGILYLHVLNKHGIDNVIQTVRGEIIPYILGN